MDRSQTDYGAVLQPSDAAPVTAERRPFSRIPAPGGLGTLASSSSAASCTMPVIYMPKLALIIRHAEPETLAENYTSALVKRGFELRPLDVFQSAPEFDEFDPPGLEEVDLIVSLGGPQSANDCYPALRAERRLLADAMASGVPDAPIDVKECCGIGLSSVGRRRPRERHSV